MSLAFAFDGTVEAFSTTPRPGNSTGLDFRSAHSAKSELITKTIEKVSISILIDGSFQSEGGKNYSPW